MLLNKQQTLNERTMLPQMEIVYRENILRETFERDEAKLRNAILVFTHNSEEVEDIFQKTFLQAIAKAESFNPNTPNASAIAWLKKVAFNIARHGWRKQQTERKYFIPIAETEAAAAKEFSVDDELSEAALYDLLKIQQPDERGKESAANAVAVLTSAEREILELRFIDGLSGEEVAAQFGVTRATVDMRVSRAKTKLRRALDFTR